MARNVSGSGVLVVPGQRDVPAQYDLNEIVAPDGRTKSAAGTIQCPYGPAHKAVVSGNSVLRLASGAEVRLVFSTTSSKGVHTVRVNGALPAA